MVDFCLVLIKIVFKVKNNTITIFYFLDKNCYRFSLLLKIEWEKKNKKNYYKRRKMIENFILSWKCSALPLSVIKLYCRIKEINFQINLIVSYFSRVRACFWFKEHLFVKYTTKYTTKQTNTKSKLLFGSKTFNFTINIR